MKNDSQHQDEPMKESNKGSDHKENKTESLQQEPLHELTPESALHETPTALEHVIEKISELEHTHFKAPHPTLEPIIEQYENTLDEIKTALENNEPEQHDFIHKLLHTLHATLIHTETLENHATESEKKSHFLDHHAAILRENNEKWFHQRYEDEMLDEEIALEAEYIELLAQLHAFQHRLKKLIELAEQEEYEAKRRHAFEPHPELKPHVEKVDDDKN